MDAQKHTTGETAEARRDVANTILTQLGGRKFCVMTGVTNFFGYPRGLSFHLPAGFAREHINYCKIVLNGLDLYDLEFGTVRGGKYTERQTSQNVHVEDL